MRIDADGKDIDIQVTAPDEALFVQADPVRLEQIIWNLLNNSVKFTPNGGRIVVQLEEENDDIVLRVSDNGQGIDPEFLGSIFGMFVQGRGKDTA